MPISEYLHVFLIFLPLVFALQLFTYKNAYSKPNRLLGFYMVFLSLYYILIKIVVFQLPAFVFFNYLLVLPIFLAFNPFYYLYVKSLTHEDFKFSFKTFKHFIPSFLLFLFLLFFVILSNIFTVHFNMLQQIEASKLPLVVVVYYCQVVLYTVLMVRLLNRHRKNLDMYFSFKENVTLDWLWLFLMIYIVFTVFDASVFFTNWFDAYYKLGYWILMLVFVVFLGYFGTKQSDIYVGKIKRRFTNGESADMLHIPDDNKRILHSISSKESAIKYEKSSLDEKQKAEMMESILAIMNEEELFKNSHLMVDVFADKLLTNKKYISQVINEIQHKNFYQFVNEYRVNYALSLMKNPDYNHYTIEAIGSMSGFNSRSSMISAFKRITGKTPSEFKEVKQSKHE
jgi:AraC-like DNA-binding protein